MNELSKLKLVSSIFIFYQKKAFQKLRKIKSLKSSFPSWDIEFFVIFFSFPSTVSDSESHTKKDKHV